MRKTTLVLGLLLTAGLLQACASPGAATVTDGERDRAQAMFERFRGLEGRWVMMDSGGASPAPAGTPVVYHVTAAGSAVVETVFEGQDHEMVTVYTMDNGRLTLTHYCAMKNQPRMIADPITEDDTVSFEAVSVGNAESLADTHMHWATFEFQDDGRLKAVWTVLKDGKPGFVGNMLLERAGS